MRKFFLRTILVLLFSTIYFPTFAGSPLFGVFSSPKGYGFNLQIGSNEPVHSFTLYLDMYGIYMSRTKIPGVKADYNRNRVFSSWDKGEYNIFLYGGPGCSLGYVFDFEPGWDILERGQGAMAALSYNLGIRMDFDKSNIVLDFSSRPELGLHIRTDKYSNNNRLSLYINGLIQSIYPQASILYKF